MLMAVVAHFARIGMCFHRRVPRWVCDVVWVVWVVADADVLTLNPISIMEVDAPSAQMIVGPVAKAV